MTEEQAVRDHLLTYSPLTALVGTRIYQLKLPQLVTLPAVRILYIDALDFFHLRGGSITKRSRIQTDAVTAEDSGQDPYAQATAVAEAIHEAMNGQVWAHGSPLELVITGAMRVQRFPMYDAAEVRQVRMVQDYVLWSREVV